MAFKLPRLPFNWKEQPQLFERYWDEVARKLEEVLTTILSVPAIEAAVAAAQAAADSAQADALAAQAAAATAQSDAVAAQTAADTATVIAETVDRRTTDARQFLDTR
jgi:hypothetical protein